MRHLLFFLCHSLDVNVFVWLIYNDLLNTIMMDFSKSLLSTVQWVLDYQIITMYFHKLPLSKHWHCFWDRLEERWDWLCRYTQTHKDTLWLFFHLFSLFGSICQFFRLTAPQDLCFVCACVLMWLVERRMQIVLPSINSWKKQPRWF